MAAKTFSVVHPLGGFAGRPCLPSLSHSDGLVVLYATQQFLRVPRLEGGRPYAPGYFRGRREEVLEALGRPLRGSVLRMVRSSLCVGCRVPVSARSAGDHLIPLHDGGSDSAENYVPMCRSCNSSKGKRDLLEWWESKDRDPLALGLDTLTIYARLKFRWLWNDAGPAVALAPAPEYLIAQVRRLLLELPSLSHRYAAVGVGARG